MYNIKNDEYEAAKNSDASAGSYHKTEIADKVQNTAIGIPKNRLRFFAQMPIVLERREAEIHAWIRGGPIPRMRDSDIAMRLEKYAELLKIAQAQPLVPSAKDKIDNLADWLIADAYQHIDDIVTDAGVDAPHPPRPAFVLSRNVSRDKRNLCKNALRSGHFQHRLSVFKVKR